MVDQVLQQLHDRLTRKLSPAAAIDPFTVLPVELAEMLLEHLSFRYMVNCMRVSKGWRDYLSKLPKLWMHLDLSGARRPVPRSFVNMAVRRSHSRLTRFTIHRFEHMDMLKNIAKACKSLEEIELISLPHAMSSTLVEIAKSTPSLKKVVVHPAITVQTATQILQHRPELEHVVFHAVQRSDYTADWTGPYKSLKTFHMHLVDTMTAHQLAVTTLAKGMPSLQALALSNVSRLGWSSIYAPLTESAPLMPLQTLELRRFNFIAFPLLPPTVRRLVLEIDNSPVIEDDIHYVSSGLPHLTDLTIHGHDDFTASKMHHLLDLANSEGRGIHAVSDGAPLTHVSIRGISEAPSGLFKGPDSLFGISPRILTKALKALDIATLPCDDDEIECLLTYETGLQSIDLSNTRITGASIKMLADKLPMLKSIRADSCPRINGRDALDYTQRKGIAVSCQMVEVKGGRKIRYG